MSIATRAVRASGFDHDITDTPTVDRHDQTRVDRKRSSDLKNSEKLWLRFF